MSLKSKVQAAAQNVKKTAQTAGSSIKTAAQSAGSAVKTGAVNVGQTTQKAGVKVAAPIKPVSAKAATAAKKIAVKAATTAKKVVNQADEKAALILFAPYLLLAKLLLKRRGITPAKAPRDIVQQVFTEMGKKSFGVTSGDAFDETPVFNTANYGFIVTAEIVIQVIQFLGGIFKTIKEKQAKGEKLSPDEQAIVAQAPEIEKSLAEAKNNAADVIAGAEKQAEKISEAGAAEATQAALGESGMFSGKNMIIIAVIVIMVLFFVLKRK